MAFCDFCTCEDCTTGTPRLVHAQTREGTWICEICYDYDVCTASGADRNPNGPCEDENCKHRPVLVTDWIR